jgi:hypothetical protein
MPRALLVFTVVVFSLIAAACSSGPQPPQPGTPGFYLASAKSTFAAGDFLKTSDNLSQLNNSSEFAARTRPWSIVMSAGLAKGYMDLAENFEYGARANRTNPAPFRRQVSQLRSMAGNAAMQCAESTKKFLAENKADTVALEFPFPRGNSAEPVPLQRVAKGMMVPDAEIEDLTKTMVQRGVLMTTARMVGASDDVAKALDTFKSGDVKVARAVFLEATAKALVDQADLYTSTKLDQPDRVKLLCLQATDALQSIPATKDTKELLAKIAKLTKTGKKT